VCGAAAPACCASARLPSVGGAQAARHSASRHAAHNPSRSMLRVCMLLRGGPLPVSRDTRAHARAPRHARSARWWRACGCAPGLLTPHACRSPGRQRLLTSAAAETPRPAVLATDRGATQQAAPSGRRAGPAPWRAPERHMKSVAEASRRPGKEGCDPAGYSKLGPQAATSFDEVLLSTRSNAENGQRLRYAPRLLRLADRLG